MGEMTAEMISKIERKAAKDLLPPDTDRRTLAAVESELNYEWWRGYFAAIAEIGIV